jgi:hypothetical protein
MFPPGVTILKADLVWEPTKPNLSNKFSLMKLWVALESNKILIGVSLIEKIPASTEAPSGMSSCGEVQLPWRMCTIGFLAGVTGLFPAP